jgi:hypothetical protein
VEKINGDLRMVNASDTTYLIPESENKFVDRVYGGVLTFIKASNAGTTALTSSFGKEFNASKLQ